MLSPIIAFRTVPPCNAGGNDRAIHTTRKLLQSAEEGEGVDDNRPRLNQGGGGIGFHRLGQADNGVAGHQTIGVEDNHMIIGRAEPLDPHRDVAGFPGSVIGSMSMVDPMGTTSAPQRHELHFFTDPDIRVGRIAQQEPIELAP